MLIIIVRRDFSFVLGFEYGRILAQAEKSPRESCLDNFWRFLEDLIAMVAR